MTATWKIWNTFSPCNFQNWNDFPSLSTTMIAQLKWKIISLVWIIPEQFITRTVLFLKNPSAKSPFPCLFASTIEMVATLSARPLPTALSYFTQENWFWKWIWKTMGEVDLDFKWAISPLPLQFLSTVEVVTIKFWSHQPSGNRFSKARQASSMLNLCPQSEDCLAFFSGRSRVTGIFNSNPTTWGNYFGVSSTVCYGLMHSDKPCPLIICKGRRTPKKIFLQ